MITVNTINDLISNIDPNTNPDVFVKGYNTVNDFGGGNFYWDSSSQQTENKGTIFESVYSGGISVGRWVRIADRELYPEMFGAKGDYDDNSNGSGTDNTERLQTLINYAAKSGIEIRLKPGAKYLTGDLLFYDDEYSGSPNTEPFPTDKIGRVKITAHCPGRWTGSAEDQGSALVHKHTLMTISTNPNNTSTHISGVTETLIKAIGDYDSDESKPDTQVGRRGQSIIIEGVNLIGGKDTQRLISLEFCSSKIELKDFTVLIRDNSDCNGIELRSCWDLVLQNGLIRGEENRDGSMEILTNPNPTNGIGLKIDRPSGENVVQTNQLIASNVNITKMRVGIELGRDVDTGSSDPGGTFSPILFNGGQVSNCTYHNVVIKSGVYSVLFNAFQSEGASGHGFLIKSGASESDPSSNFPRNVTLKNCHITNNGYIDKYVNDPENPINLNSEQQEIFDKVIFQYHIIDGKNCSIENCYFQNTRNGILIDGNKSTNFRANQVSLRPLNTNQGVGVSVYDSTGSNLYSPYNNIVSFENFEFQADFNENFDTLAKEAYGIYKYGGPFECVEEQNNIGTLTIQPNVKDVKILNFNFDNNNNPIGGWKVVNFLGGENGQIITLTFRNSKTTIDDNANIYLKNGSGFTPSNETATLSLICYIKNGETKWKELSSWTGAEE